MKKRWISLLMVALTAFELCGCASQNVTLNIGTTDTSSDVKVDLSKIDGYMDMRFIDVEDSDPIPVYYTRDISPEGLMNVYHALGWNAGDSVGIKITTGESEKTNHLSPALIKDLVDETHANIVECNTAYEGNRSDTKEHYKLAEEHGYTAIAKVDIMDEEGMISLPVNNGNRLSENIVGSHFNDYDSFIILSHFKGHMMAGYGGAIKNTSIGMAAAPDGKINIHTGGQSKTEFMDEVVDEFQDAMAEATLAVSDAVGKENIIYINVMNNISVDCDCDPNPAKPDIHDFGILASNDPIALDQACIDIAACMDGSGTLLLRVADRHGLRSLEHGQEIGLGSRRYELICVDK